MIDEVLLDHGREAIAELLIREPGVVLEARKGEAIIALES